jgi:beta-lactamase regulating signal transducer with metallopeptidase domain
VETLLHVGLSNALVALVLAAGAALVSRVARRPALVHSLWLLVLLKLITPPLVSFPVPALKAPEYQAAASAPTSPAIRQPSLLLTYIVSAAESAEAESALDAPERSMATDEVAVTDPNALQAIAPIDEAVSDAPDPFESRAEWHLPPWPMVLFGVWASGSILWIGVAAWRIVRFGWLVRLARPAPAAVRARVAQLSEHLGIAVCPHVDLVPGCISPLLWALSGRPRLLLPSALWDKLDLDQRDALLVHELAHLRRCDHWIRKLELAVTALYWWHPVVWWARRALREAEEQCCDAWVVWALPASARAYATALLQTVDFLSGARAGLPVAASGLGHLACLKRRLIMIMQEPKPRTLSWAGRLAVLGLGAMLLPLAPSWAERSAIGDDQPKEQAVRIDVAAADDDKDDDDDQESKDRDKQLEQARNKMKEMQAQLADRQKKVHADFQKAQEQLQAKMQEAQRELMDAQKKLEQVMRQVAELEQAGQGGKKGEQGDKQARIHLFPGQPGQFRYRFDSRFGEGGLPDGVTRLPGKPGQPDVFVHRRDGVQSGPGMPGGGPGGGMPDVFLGGMSPQTERRLADLEKKLDRLLDEVAKLKKSKANEDNGGQNENKDRPARR